jgi:hypothetical protein
MEPVGYGHIPYMLFFEFSKREEGPGELLL